MFDIMKDEKIKIKELVNLINGYAFKPGDRDLNGKKIKISDCNVLR